MEHRHSSRACTDIQALIYKGGMPVVIGRIKNLSKHGAYIQCASSGLTLYQPLEIELLMQGPTTAEKLRFKCFLTRKETQGLAIAVFDEYQPQYAKHTEYIVDKWQRAQIPLY